MKRSVGLLFFALTFVVFLLSCGISVTEGARLLKQNYDEEDAGDEIGEMNAMRYRRTHAAGDPAAFDVLGRRGDYHAYSSATARP